MAFLFRRIVIALLIPFLWRRWRERSAARSAGVAGGGPPGSGVV